MIGYWHHVVRLSVCLSVTLCIVALKVGVRAKSYIYINSRLSYFL